MPSASVYYMPTNVISAVSATNTTSIYKSVKHKAYVVRQLATATHTKKRAIVRVVTAIINYQVASAAR